MLPVQSQSPSVGGGRIAGSRRASDIDSAGQNISVGNWVEKQKSSPSRMPGHGKLNSDFNCLAGFNNRGKIPQGRQKSNTIKVLRTNILGKS